MIACVFIPYFATSLERQFDPMLNGRPLIISQPGRPARVLAVSAEAAVDGVKPGMSVQQAQTICPRVQEMPANFTRYHDTLKQIASWLAAATPKVEAGPDYLMATLYADLGQLNRAEQFEFADHISQTVQQQIQLTPALGLARGKFPAYVAAGSIGPNRVLCIAPGQESSFLAPLEVTCLPLDRELARRLGLLGLRTVGQFAALSTGAVLTQFGTAGRWLHQLAQGHDDRPVLPHPAQPIEALTYPFDGPIPDWLTLLAFSQTLAEELGARLMARGYSANQLTLTLHLEDGTQQTKQRRLRQPTASAPTLARHLAALIERIQLTGNVIAVTVQATELIPLSFQQLDLFSEQSPAEQTRQLYALIPQLVARYGPACFYQPVITNPQATLPERRFEFRAVLD